ncbi:MAG: hypothetical protein LBI30_02745 [Holosporales bacterium]|jgi:methionyl-tRNA formyltransferase|nr:hypothetical protein [Holosporales bacterium]
MNSFSIILYDSARARSYIQHLCENGLFPNEVLLMPGCWEPPANLRRSKKISFDFKEPVQETISKYRLKIVSCKTQDINNENTIENIKKRSSDQFIIFGGAGGQILKKPVLSQGVPILHIHPGIVPNYRGSTTIYYSMLVEGKAGCSAFFFNEKIDDGPLVLRKTYKLIRGINIDYMFDPEIRGLMLVEAVKKLTLSMRTTIVKKKTLPYFIIHPVLKHIAMLKNT